MQRIDHLNRQEGSRHLIPSMVEVTVAVLFYVIAFYEGIRLVVESLLS